MTDFVVGLKVALTQSSTAATQAQWHTATNGEICAWPGVHMVAADKVNTGQDGEERAEPEISGVNPAAIEQLRQPHAHRKTRCKS